MQSFIDVAEGLMNYSINANNPSVISFKEKLSNDKLLNLRNQCSLHGVFDKRSVMKHQTEMDMHVLQQVKLIFAMQL